MRNRQNAMVFLLLFAPVMFAQERLTVSIDPRIELLTAVQLLAGYGEKYGLLTKFDDSYKRDMQKYFAPWHESNAVRLFEDMSKGGFTYDAPPTLMIYLSAPPELQEVTPLPTEVVERAGGKEKLEAFVIALHKFALDSRFTNFYESHKPVYDRMVAAVGDPKDGLREIDTLERYYGMKQHGYHIVLAPLFVGAYGPRVPRPDGTFDLFNITGPISVQDSLPSFGSIEGLLELGMHEFGHSFVNPTTDKFGKEIDEFKSLLDPIAEKMSNLAYGNWRTCVNEHLVRAVTTRLNYRERGVEMGDAVMGQERAWGFAYLPARCKKLEEYEQHRDKYAAFVDFYPEIIGVFRSLKEQNLGDVFYKISFVGTINEVTLHRENLAYILPTHEADTAAQRKLHEYIRRVRDRFNPGAKIILDDEALESNMNNTYLLIYGTIEGNSWLTWHRAIMPFQIDTGKILADSMYTGKGLRFITSLPNPADSTLGIVVYTAQTTADVIGINSVFHGPTNYVVAKGRDVLRAGNYTKENGVWKFR